MANRDDQNDLAEEGCEFWQGKVPEKPGPLMPAKCKTCPFRKDAQGEVIALRATRAVVERVISGYQHPCHAPQRQGKPPTHTCRGSHEYRIEVWHKLGHIPEPTEESLNATLLSAGVMPHWLIHQPDEEDGIAEGEG